MQSIFCCSIFRWYILEALPLASLPKMYLCMFKVALIRACDLAFQLIASACLSHADIF